MKKITFIIINSILFAQFLIGQTLNQDASWPNSSWTVEGTYDPTALISNPTTTANFSYDDDAAGSGSTDEIQVQSPTIDLTAASNAGETWIEVSHDYNYNYGTSFTLEYYDADTASWILWNDLPDNSASTSNWCASLAPNTSSILDIGSFTASQLTGFRYRFNYDSSSVYGWGVCTSSPTITSQAPPSCLDPSALSASNVATSSADLSWIAVGTESLWNIEYGLAGYTQGNGTTVSASTNPYTLNGLTSGTTYDIYIQADCGAGDTSDWVGPVSFTLACDTVDSFSENFDGVSSMEFPDCWAKIGSSGTVKLDEGYDNSAPNALYLYSSSTTNIATVGMVPVSNLGAGTHRFTFNMRANFTAGGVVEIGYLTDANDPDSFISLGNVVSNSTSYESYTFTPPAGTYSNYPAMRHTGSPANSISIDDVVWEAIPSCLELTDLATPDITSSSAVLSWTADASQSLFNVEVVDVTNNESVTGTPTESGVTNPFTLTGLTANNDYEFYVQADCGGGDTSSWAGPVSFTTACSAISSFPWTEDFESVTTPALPSCFSELNNNSDSYYWKTYSSYGTSSSKAVGMYTDFNSGNNDDYLILPQFTLTGNERLKYSVRARSSSEPNDYKVVLSTTGNSAADFTTDLMALTTVSSTSHEEQIINLSAYSGDVYIAIHVPSGGLDGYYIYFDDFTVEALPSCSAPTAITVSEITDCCADISWNAGDSETDYEYVVQAAGTGEPTTAGTAVTGSTTVSVGPLAANTDFEVYIRSNCGANGFSSWAGPVNFTTEPAPIVPNYTNDFSTFPGEFWSEGSGALNAGPAGSSSLWEADGFGNSGTTGAARINLYGTKNEWLISPTFDLSSGTFYLNVDAAATEFASTAAANFGADDIVILLASTDNGVSWEELYEWNATTDPGPTGTGLSEITLENYTATSKFAFYGNATSSSFSEDVDFFVDNFQITSTSLGIEENNISLFNYFPNPVNDVLTIKAQKDVDNITVYNMLGQVVIRQTPNTRDCTVNLSTMQTGAYFVQVSIDNSVETVRVLKN